MPTPFTENVIAQVRRISFPWESPAFTDQRRRLTREGVEFGESGKVELPRFQWRKGL